MRFQQQDTTGARMTRVGAGVLIAIGLAATPAHAYNIVPSANGEAWGVQDVAAPRVDTGSIRDTTSAGLRGYGGIRVKVSTNPRFNGELMRGFRLQFNPPERFSSTQSVDMGGVAVSRNLRFNRNQNWGRWLDTFKNTTDAPIDVKVAFGGQLGIGNAAGTTNAVVADSSSGDAVAGTNDAWVEYRTGAAAATTTQGPTATVLGTPPPFGAFQRLANFVRQTFELAPTASGHESNFVGFENDFTLQPGQVRTLAHFVAIGTTESATGTGTTAPGAQIAAVRAVAAGLADQTSTAYLGFSDFTKQQICALVNWDPTKITNVAGFSAAADCAGASAPAVPPLGPATPTTTGSPYDVVGKTIDDLVTDMKAGRTTSRQIVRAYLDRIAAYDGGPFGFNSVPTVAEDALAQASAADAARASGDTRPLLGVPLLVKDLYDTKDMTTTNGSLAFEGYRPPTDATQVAKLREAGAIIMGKAAMEEYALSGQYSDDFRGQVWNAFQPSKSSLASSGGSAVATALSFAAGSLGSQTGDSLYAPASAASLWTLRGTDGMASSHGVMPLSYLQDYAGALATAPGDLAALLNATTGTDPLDETTVAADADHKRPADWRTALDANALKGKRIGYHPSAFVDPFATTGTVNAALAGLQKFVDAGATLVQLTGNGPALPANTAGGARDFHGWALWIQEHPNAPYDDPRQILASPKRLPYRRQTNGYTGAGDMSPANVATYKQFRADAKTAVATYLDNPPNPVIPGTATPSPGAIDALAYPGLRSDISLNDGGSSAFGRGDPPSNSAGTPTVAFPAGVNDHGEPLNLQIIGRAFDDAKLLGYAYAYDQVAHGHVLPTTAPALRYVADPTPPVITTPTPVAPEPAPIPAPAVTRAPGPAPAAAQTKLLPSSFFGFGKLRRLTVRGRVIKVIVTVPGSGKATGVLTSRIGKRIVPLATATGTSTRSQGLRLTFHISAATERILRGHTHTTGVLRVTFTRTGGTHRTRDRGPLLIKVG
jgi:amidase